MSDPRPIAVVTGASRGIGRAIALAFAGGGYEVWALARDASALDALKEDAAENAVRPLTVDVLKEAEVRAACERILQTGVPRVLVNNAGIALSAPLQRTTLEDYDRVMSINCRAPFLFCQALIPAMAKAGEGRVINIASTAAFKGLKYTSAYTASKHALLGLTRSLAMELAQKNVTVNAVCPGWTDTDMVERSAQAISQATGRSKADAVQTLAEMNPMKRLIRPEDVAQLCLFLASPAASTVTGAAYAMDGGGSSA